MSKISLRSYRKEIGALIGKGRDQSAIIHRRHGNRQPGGLPHS